MTKAGRPTRTRPGSRSSTLKHSLPYPTFLSLSVYHTQIQVNMSVDSFSPLQFKHIVTLSFSISFLIFLSLSLSIYLSHTHSFSLLIDDKRIQQLGTIVLPSINRHSPTQEHLPHSLFLSLSLSHSPSHSLLHTYCQFSLPHFYLTFDHFRNNRNLSADVFIFLQMNLRTKCSKIAPISQ